MYVIFSSPWNSLEIVKIFVALLTPILIFLVGFYINKSLINIEHNQWRNQKLIEKRIQVYDDIMPELNDLLCYFTRVGDWKKFSPMQIVDHKRSIDRKLHLSAPLFGEDYFLACSAFIELCFETYTGSGEDAKLKTTVDERKKAFRDEWDPEWDRYFCNPEKASKWKDIRKAYSEIVKIFSREMGLNPDTKYRIKSKVAKSILSISK